MRFVRLRHQDLDYFAAIVDDGTARLWDGPPWAGGRETDRLVPTQRCAPLTPVAPSKIVCVGRNYRAHAKELGNEVPSEPLLFLKPPTALLGPGGTIVLPSASERVEHEGELVVVIGRRLERATRDEARAGVFGYTAGNDVTARDLQKKDVQFTRAKGFDTFAPVGPAIVTDLDPSDVRVRVEVGAEARQDGRTSSMVFDVFELVRYVSNVMTLLPGDILFTGTPEGVGPLRDGDTVRVTIDGVGTLENRVGRA